MELALRHPAIKGTCAAMHSASPTARFALGFFAMALLTVPVALAGPLDRHQLPPLPADLRADLMAIPADPAPKEIINGVHYVISNEYRQELFHDALKNQRGGIHIGVGAEQNYLFAGWSQPDFLILLDFDRFIVDLHSLYEIAFLNAATPDDFVDLWQAKSRKTFFRLINESTEKRARRARLKRIYKHSRIFVSKRAKYIRRHYPKKGVPTFLTDPKQYATIVRLFRTGRVLPIRGDFTANRAMKGIADFAKKHDLRVSTLYLSNVEYYFSFGTKHYRENILAQPFAEQSTVMHTIPHSSTEYYYLWHTGDNFQQWLRCHCVRKYRYLLQHSDAQGDREKRWLTKEPPSSPKTP